jgi:hypothetical protein
MDNLLLDEQYDSDNYSRLKEETEFDDYVEQDIMFMNEDEDEITRRRRKVWEGLMKWAYGGVGQAGGEVGNTCSLQLHLNKIVLSPLLASSGRGIRQYTC